MGWFEDIPTAFTAILAVIAAIGAIFFIATLDFSSSANPDENLEKTTGYLTNNIVPTEVSWLDKAANSISNPFALLIVILGIMWLFGYFKK